VTRTVYAVLLAVGLVLLLWEVTLLAYPAALPAVALLGGPMGIGVGILHVSRRGWW